MPMQVNSEKMCTVHLWSVKNKGISRGFEPRASWRELEQQRRELSVGESQQQHPRQPEQQRWLPPGVRPVAQKQSRMTASEQIDDPAPDSVRAKSATQHARALVGRAG